MRQDIELANEYKDYEDTLVDFLDDGGLLPHQILAGKWMLAIQRGLLLDEMGSGRTYSSISFLQNLEKELSVVHCCVFAPANMHPHWKSVIEQYLGWILIIVDGSKSHRQAQYEYFNDAQKSAILLTNYSRPLHDKSEMLKLSVDSWLFDEAVALKNPEAEIHKLVDQLISENSCNFMMTGTPFTLSLGDMYWLFYLTKNKGVISSFEEEVEPYLHVINKYRGRGKVIGASGYTPFEEKIEPYILRRSLKEIFKDTVSQETQFVEKGVSLQVVPLHYSQAQIDAFNDLKKRANQDARAGKYEALTYHAEFHKVCCSPSMAGYNTDVTPKENYALNYILSVNGEQVIIFIRYIDYLKRVTNFLLNNNVSAVSISGRNSAEEIELYLSDFKNGLYQVLLISEIGKAGLNLQTANHMLLLGLPRNPADFVQMIGRIYRYGQTKDVDVKICFIENTVEEDAMRDLAERQKLYDEFFDRTNFAEILWNIPLHVRGFLEKDYS